MEDCIGGRAYTFGTGVLVGLCQWVRPHDGNQGLPHPRQPCLGCLGQLQTGGDYYWRILEHK